MNCIKTKEKVGENKMLFYEVPYISELCVSREGVVFTTSNKSCEVKPYIGKGGSGIMLNYKKDGVCKHLSLPKLVATMFVPNPNPLKFTRVGFKDGNWCNCRADNLVWLEVHEKMKYKSDKNLKLDWNCDPCEFKEN